MPGNRVLASAKTYLPSSVDYQIRAAKVSDVPALTRMRLALQEHMERRNGRIWKLSKSKIARIPAFFKELLLQRDTVVLVAEKIPNGSLIGMAIGAVQRHDDFLVRRSGKIDDVWVHPRYRRKGVCRGLMAGLAAHFRKHRVQLTTLVYCLGNNEAEQTWKRLGFTPVLISASTDLQDFAGRTTQR